MRSRVRGPAADRRNGRPVAALEAAGHPVRWDTELVGVRRGYVDDPFGNRIELIES